MILEWPCKWKGCKIKLNEKDNHYNKKYCDEHAIAMRKLQRKKINKKRYELRKVRPKGKCKVCKGKLDGAHRKFCSQECTDKFYSNIRKRKWIEKSIEYHSKKIQELVIKLN